MRDQKIYAMVSRIPEGTVATYGQIAGLVGVGPRQVGRALARMPENTKCPWHRVVNARGEAPPRSGSKVAHHRQQRRLEREGVAFRNGKVDLNVYRWYPDV
jgi:methylated-DNA-protein-cysteine methyltransferase-like protein